MFGLRDLSWSGFLPGHSRNLGGRRCSPADRSVRGPDPPSGAPGSSPRWRSLAHLPASGKISDGAVSSWPAWRTVGRCGSRPDCPGLTCPASTKTAATSSSSGVSRAGMRVPGRVCPKAPRLRPAALPAAARSWVPGGGGARGRDDGQGLHPRLSPLPGSLSGCSSLSAFGGVSP